LEDPLSSYSTKMIRRSRIFWPCFFMITQMMVYSVKCFISTLPMKEFICSAFQASNRYHKSCFSPASFSIARKFASPSKAVEEEVDPGEVAGLSIVKYPHPALRAENAEITEFDDSLKKLSKDMFKLMYAAQGVGLAAPQVAQNVRLMVFNPEADPKKWLMETTLVNPEIVESSEGKDMEIEGCLSFPGMNGPVQRSKWIKVKYQDVKGKPKKKKFVGWEARIFQHEYDHLQGTVYIDRLSEEDRQQVQPRLDELIAEHGEGGAL